MCQSGAVVFRSLLVVFFIVIHWQETKHKQSFSSGTSSMTVIYGWSGAVVMLFGCLDSLSWALFLNLFQLVGAQDVIGQSKNFLHIVPWTLRWIPWISVTFSWWLFRSTQLILGLDPIQNKESRKKWLLFLCASLLLPPCPLSSFKNPRSDVSISFVTLGSQRERVAYGELVEPLPLPYFKQSFIPGLSQPLPHSSIQFSETKFTFKGE